MTQQLPDYLQVIQETDSDYEEFQYFLTNHAWKYTENNCQLMQSSSWLKFGYPNMPWDFFEGRWYGKIDYRPYSCCNTSEIEE